LEIVERFGTAKIFARVRHVYERFSGARTCDAAPTAFAYFFRAAPAYARAQIRGVAEQIFRRGSCDTGVLVAAAKRRMTPALEQVAINLLNETDGRIADDAVRTLKEYGGAGARPALEDAFERWHRRWEGRVTELEADWRSSDGVPWDVYLEEDLCEALLEGTAWLNDDASLLRISGLCLSARCKMLMESRSNRLDGDKPIAVEPPRLPAGEPSFFVGDGTDVLLRSRDALRRRLALHAVGTAFVWEAGRDARLPGVQGTVDAVEPGEYFEDMRAYAETLGIRLTAHPYAWPRP
jgi:hypothetical protein